MLNKYQQRIEDLKFLADTASTFGDDDNSDLLEHISDLRDVLDLAALVRNLARKIPKDDPLRIKALEFLKRRGLLSALR